MEQQTLTSLLDEWLADQQAVRRSQRTLEWYRDETVGPFVAWRAEQGVADASGLAGGHLRTHILERLDHLAEATQHNRVAAIKAFSPPCPCGYRGGALDL